MNYSELIKKAHGRCGGKSQVRFCDSKELAGHLAEMVAQNEAALKVFVALGKRRLAKKKRMS